MRVYFINSGLQGCYTVRCLLPLVANGWDGDQTSLNVTTKTPENKKEAAVNSDVVVFHRPDTPEKLQLAKLLKKSGKKIVFDNDDTFKDDGGFKFNEFMNEERLRRGLKRINESVDEFIKEADLVTCSTEFLKKEYLELNDNVIVVPNCVDPFYFDEPQRNTGDKVRIGIVGSIAITSDVEVLEPIVKELSKRDDVRVVLFSMPPNSQDKLTRELYSDEYKFWESVDVEWQPFVNMEDYYNTLNELKLDIMIIPRADNYFNRCKSNLKFLEASMFEIPVVAQSFPDGQSPYEVNPKDAEHMILVKNDWMTPINKLILDKDLRLKMGREAKQYVLENYDIEKNAHRWEEAYRTLWK